MTAETALDLESLTARLDAVITALDCPRCKGHGWIFERQDSIDGERFVGKLEKCPCQERVKQMVWGVKT